MSADITPAERAAIDRIDDRIMDVIGGEDAKPALCALLTATARVIAFGARDREHVKEIVERVGPDLHELIEIVWPCMREHRALNGPAANAIGI